MFIGCIDGNCERFGWKEERVSNLEMMIYSLKIVVMSATIEIEKFCKYFETEAVIKI
jgi:HrpA-like RNA helicase